MAAFSFDVGFYELSQFTISGLTPAQIQGETIGFGNGVGITLNGAPTVTTISVDDDDGSSPNSFDDGFVDTPADDGTPSTGANDQLLSAPVTIDGTTYPAGSQVELEFEFSMTSPGGETITGYMIRIDGDNVGFTFVPSFPEVGVTYTTTELTEEESDANQIPIETIPCFTPGSMVMTPDGLVAVETLNAGDIVLTKDNGAKPVRWVGSKKLSAKELQLTPSLRPILIETGAMGNNTPDRDMYVSPEHRMVINNAQVALLFGVDEALTAARSMVNGDTIRIVQPEDGVEYIHLMFDRHEIIFVDGTETESFFPGEITVSNLEDGPRKELLGLFPELGLKGHKFGKLARRSLKKAEAELVL